MGSVFNRIANFCVFDNSVKLPTSHPPPILFENMGLVETVLGTLGMDLWKGKEVTWGGRWDRVWGIFCAFV